MPTSINQIRRVFLVSLASCLCLTALQLVGEPASSPPSVDAQIKSLRAAIDDLGSSFPKYDAASFLKRLADIEKRQKEISSSPNATANAVDKELATLKRDAMLANPLLLQQPIVFVSRHQYLPDHHNTATLFLTKECNTGSYRGGGALKVLDPVSHTVRTIVDAGANGVPRDPDVHFNGQKIAFSMRRNIEDDYHVYEVQADGSNLHQLTRLTNAADIDPIYLPDGGIAFSSTREPKYCGCNQHIMANLYHMEGDGANIYRIGGSTLFEGHNRLMPDGRILYVRWEYVDRNFGDAQGLWTVNPDGTSHAIYWGNNKPSPGAVLDPHPVPGTGLVICTFSSCHDRPWGALALIDRRRGIDAYATDKESVLLTWPRSARDIVGNGGIDAFTQVRPRYEDPFPLSDKYFLCSREVDADDCTGTGPKPEMGIYLVDTFGNETLVHAEAPGCFNPTPLAPHKAPPIIPVRRLYDHSPALVYVLDCLQGTHMKGVSREDIKYLRVVESPEKRHWTGPVWNGQGVQRPAMNWHNFENKRILGTVPVETDGSVSMEIPSDTFVFFQLLDKDHRMIQSMRSGIVFQAGEKVSCIGCHDNRLTSPKTPSKMPKALTRKPSTLDGWYGKPRLFSYMAEVQPVFDQKCVRCHDFGKRAGRILNLSGDLDLYFNASYESLYQNWNKPNGSLHTVGAGPAEIQPANSWGSRVSPLVNKLSKGHKGIHLSTEEMDRIATWIDLNAPYYPSFACAYPDNMAGRSPLNDAELKRLKELTGVDFFAANGFSQLNGPQANFTRPELSPCLDKIVDPTSPKYKEALDLIQTGAKRLAKHPRGDTIDFTPCQTDRDREAKYQQRYELEWRNRQAIQNHKKVYDP